MGSGKGQLGMEVLLVLIVVVVVAVGFVMVWPTFKQLNDDLQNEEEFASVAKGASQEMVGDFANRMDNVYFFMFILFWIFLLGVAFLGDTHPAFFVITLVLMVFTLVVGMILSNAYQEMRDDLTADEFIDLASEWPKLNWLMEHLLIVLIFMTGSTGMVLYGKVRA